MTKSHKQKLIVIFALAVVAGAFFSCTEAASAQTLCPWNVVATVHCQNAEFHYDLQQQIVGLEQNAASRGFFLGKKGKIQLAEQLVDSGLLPQAVYEYLLPGFGKLVDFFGFVNAKKRDATVSFGKNGFEFTEGQKGVAVDCDRLFFALLESGGKCVSVELPLVVERAVTVAELKAVTVKKASFTTTFSASSPNRCHNVALATESVDGTTVLPGETFSFNQIVGPRTEARGYKQSKIISDGTYVDGVGGGVCQVSTTLFNALLLAELEPKATTHSLVSSYVLAGFDAMVSFGAADLTFLNASETPLYIQGKTDLAKRTVTFTVYGAPNKYRVRRENEEVREKFITVEVVDAQKYPDLVYVDQTRVVTSGSDGVKAKAYLLFYDGDRLVERRLLRTATYKRVDKVVARGYKQRDLPD